MMSHAAYMANNPFAKPSKRRGMKGHGPWCNWYINRGRFPLGPSNRDLRMTSWRRAK